jgi:hypothetical protein
MASLFVSGTSNVLIRRFGDALFLAKAIVDVGNRVVDCLLIVPGEGISQCGSLLRRCASRSDGRARNSGNETYGTNEVSPHSAA